MQIGSNPAAPAKKRSALPNLSAAVSEGKALRDEVVESLKKTLEVTGVTVVDPQAWRSGVGGLDEVSNVTKTHLNSRLRGVTTSLGATGGALGGVCSAQGNGALLSAAGVGLIATGLGVAPGVGLLVAGTALPLQPPRLASKWAGRTLAQATERMAGRLDGWVGKFRHTIQSDLSSKP